MSQIPSKKIESLASLAEVVKNLKGPVAVVGHVRPDGDCVGACVGMVELLKARGMDVFGMTPDPVPEYLRFLLGDVLWKEPDAKALEDRTVVAVDVPGKRRLGGGFPVALAIDHHFSHEQDLFADSYYVDVQQASASQIISSLARMLEGKVNPKQAKALYAGILMDTLSFTVGASNAAIQNAMNEASWLISQGADGLGLCDRLIRNTRRAYLRYLNFVLERAEYLENGKILLVGVNQKDIDALGATDEDRVNVGNFLVSIEGVEVSAIIRENNGVCKGSLRGRENEYRLDLLAREFGSGGHQKASGVGGEGIKEPLETFLPRFRAALLSHWKTYGVSPK
jgi:phosphoesterase RecJ-like protein